MHMPDEKRSTSMIVHCTPAVKAEVKRLADAEHRTLSAMVEQLLREALAARKGKK